MLCLQMVIGKCFTLALYQDMILTATQLSFSAAYVR